MNRFHGGKVANQVLGTWGGTSSRLRRSPAATDEIKARARELYAEAPGENRRVAVRIFREFGVKYSDSTILRWMRDA